MYRFIFNGIAADYQKVKVHTEQGMRDIIIATKECKK